MIYRSAHHVAELAGCRHSSFCRLKWRMPYGTSTRTTANESETVASSIGGKQYK
jgi:hypothetical protein